MKFQLSLRQIFSLVLLSAIFSAATVTGINFFDRPPYVAGAAADSAPSGVAVPSMASDEQNNVEVYRAVAPGVVFITSSAAGGGGSWDSGGRRGAGSGSVIDRQGHILTNDHVVSRAARISVSLGGERTYPARVVGRDPDTDLAVIKIDVPADQLTVVEFGDSNSLVVGQKVLAIGNPFGLDRTLTTGVISGLQRPLRARNGRQIEGAIQTDASINPGNSGGPLLNSRGQMIGINSQILSATGSSSGIGFAVPASIARRVVPQLIRSGYVARPRLGVTTRGVRALGGQANLPVAEGVLIMTVEPGSAAAAAGLRATAETEGGEFRLGDVITRIDGEEIEGPDDITRVLDRRGVGDTVQVEVARDGGRVVVPVRFGAARRTGTP